MPDHALPLVFFYVVLDHRNLQNTYATLKETHAPGAENDILATWSFMSPGEREELLDTMALLSVPVTRVSVGCWDPIVLTDEASRTYYASPHRVDSWLMGQYQANEFRVWAE